MSSFSRSLLRPLRLAVGFVVAIGATEGCSRDADTASPVAAPQVALTRAEAVVGGPLEMKYRFQVAPGAPPFEEDYWVFVHFVDTDGEMMWTDDHQPPIPTRNWKSGGTIEYERTMFLPRFPYVGETAVEVGLFSRRTGQRLPLEGQTRGQRAYRVASFNLRLPEESFLVVFKDGWHSTEQADSGPEEWQWSKKNATLAFRNPKRDVLLYLQVDRTTGFSEPQFVELRVGDTTIDAFSLSQNQKELRKVPLTAPQLGAGDTVEIQLSVDRTFVPAAVPELKSKDRRELGVRVFRAYIQPR